MTSRLPPSSFSDHTHRSSPETDVLVDGGVTAAMMR
jgi:hypothetical protein